MGIKFRSKTSAGDPASGAIKERELEINLVDGTLFTSSDGTDIVPLGGGNFYYVDLKKDQAANFNDMYNGIDTIKDGYAVSSIAQGDAGVFVGTYVADQDIGGAAEAKILVGTLNRDNPIEPTQGTIYVYKTGSMAFVSAGGDFVPTEPSLVTGSRKVGNMVLITQPDYDLLPTPRDPDTIFVITV